MQSKFDSNYKVIYDMRDHRSYCCPTIYFGDSGFKNISFSHWLCHKRLIHKSFPPSCFIGSDKDSYTGCFFFLLLVVFYKVPYMFL